MMMATAVATCSPTMYARYGDSFRDTFRSLAHCPPASAGMSTACPRLEIGNSSVIPWISPTTPASKNVRCDMPPLAPHATTWRKDQNHCPERASVRARRDTFIVPRAYVPHVPFSCCLHNVTGLLGQAL